MSQMSEAMVAALRKKPTSFEQSAAERAKPHPEYQLNDLVNRGKATGAKARTLPNSGSPFVPNPNGILKVDKALYDAGVGK